MLSYGGIDLPAITSEVSQWVTDNILVRDLYQFVWDHTPGPRYDHLDYHSQALFTPSPPEIELGTLFYPTTATRWAVGYFLATDSELQKLRGLAYSGGISALPFVMGDGIDRITTNLFMLPPMPFAQVGGEEGLHLLTLVDERYFWWVIADSITVDGGTTTWADLYEDIGTALGIAIVTGTIDADYLKPSELLSSQYDYLPPLLDAVAINTGRRIVRSLDGTITAQTVASAKTSQDLQLTKWDKTAGGTYLFRNRNRVDLHATIPATVKVTFPRTDSGTPSSTLYVEDVTLASLSLPTYPADFTGHAGKIKRFHSSATATFTGGGSPTNATELEDLANLIASDWYQWQLARQSTVYAGIIPYDPEGMSDYIAWTHRDSRMVTEVMRGPFNDLTEDLSHYGTGGSLSSCCKGIYWDGTNISIPGMSASFDDFTIVNSFSGDSISFDISDSTITWDTDVFNVNNSTVTFNSTTNVTFEGDVFIDNDLIDIDITTINIDQTTIDITNCTINFNSTTDITFETGVTITFNSGSDLVLDNLVEVGKNGDATVTVENGTDLIWTSTGKIDMQAGSIEFGTTSDVSVAPAGSLLIPVLSATGAPTWSATSSNITINTANNRVYYYNGSAWDEVGDNLTELDVSTTITVGVTSATSASSVTIIDGGADKPGQLILYSGEAVGVPYYLWVDSAGKFRIHDGIPSDEDGDGTKFVQTNFINEVTNIIVIDATSGTRIENNLYIGTNVDTVSNELHLYGGGANEPGLLLLYHAGNASKCYIWCDTAGKMRKYSDKPTDEDADGKKLLLSNLIDEDGPGTSLIIDTPSGYTRFKNIIDVGDSDATQGENIIRGGGADNPGLLTLYTGEATGVPYYVWMDSNGDLRKHTSKPTDEDADGTVIGGGGTDVLAKVSANDTTAGYLNGKLVAGSGVTLTENNDGSNETLTIASPNAGNIDGNYVLLTERISVSYTDMTSLTGSSDTLDIKTFSNKVWIQKFVLKATTAFAAPTLGGLTVEPKHKESDNTLIASFSSSLNLETAPDPTVFLSDDGSSLTPFFETGSKITLNLSITGDDFADLTAGALYVWVYWIEISDS